MEKKIQKTFVDTGFGFPVTLLNVPMIKLRGKWTPQIDYNLLTQSVLLAISEKAVRITGNEIRFIRLHFEMTLEEFANRFAVSHAAVIKWERALDEMTKMSWSTEKDLRLFILSKMRQKPQKLVKLYESLEKARSLRKRKLVAPIRPGARSLAPAGKLARG